MFSLMAKAENEKHAHRRHHNKRHGNSRMKEPVSMEIRAHKQENKEGAAVVLCAGSVFAHSKMSSMAPQIEKMTSDDCRSHRTLGRNRIKRLDACEINEEILSFKILRFEEKWLRMSLRTGCKKGFIMSSSGPRTQPCGTPQMTRSHPHE